MPLAPGLCLVTGATGFLGSAVARALLRAGQEVRVLARPTSDRRNLADLSVEIAVGAMEDTASLARAIAGCRYLFHVAADYRLWVPDPAAMYRANVDGTRELMRAALAAGVERIVYTSSVATLGIVAGGSADEITPSRLGDMIGPYKRSKFLAEEAVRGMIAEHGLPAVIVNPSTPIGPRDVKPTPTGRLILEAAKGHMPGYVDTGLNVVHVDDVADGELLAAEKGRIGERYILGGENMSLGRDSGACRAGCRAAVRRGSKYPTRSRSRLRHSAQRWRESPGASRLRRSTVFGCHAKRCISHRRKPSANLVTNRGRRAKPLPMRSPGSPPTAT